MATMVTTNTDGSTVTSGNYLVFLDSSGNFVGDSGIGPTGEGTFRHSNNVNSNTTIFEFAPIGTDILLTIKWNQANGQYTFTTGASTSLSFLNVEGKVYLSSGSFYDVIMDANNTVAPPYSAHIALSGTIALSAVYYLNTGNETVPGIIRYNASAPFYGKYYVGLATSSSVTYKIEFTTQLVPNATPKIFTAGFWDKDVS